MTLGFTGQGSDGIRLDLAPLQQMRGYWEGLRKAGHLPRRADVDPRGIAGALECAFLLERIAPGIARFRISGMMIHDLLGMEPAGMPLSVLFDPAGRNRLAPALEKVFAEPAALELRLEAERGLSRPALSAKMLILPLADAAGEPTLALGGLVLGGVIGRQPRRFGIASVVTETTPRVITAIAAAPRTPSPRPALAELAEAPAPFTPRSSSERPWLRLVTSND